MSQHDRFRDRAPTPDPAYAKDQEKVDRRAPAPSPAEIDELLDSSVDLDAHAGRCQPYEMSASELCELAEFACDDGLDDVRVDPVFREELRMKLWWLISWRHARGRRRTD